MFDLLIYLKSFLNNLFLKKIIVSVHIIRVATNSGKLREFSSRRKSKGNSGNFDIFFKLREVLIFSKKFREVLNFFKSQDIFLLYLEWDLINLVQYVVQEINFI